MSVNILLYVQHSLKSTDGSFLVPKILSRCDLSLIQEVRDSKGEAVKVLVKALNR